MKFKVKSENGAGIPVGSICFGQFLVQPTRTEPYQGVFSKDKQKVISSTTVVIYYDERWAEVLPENVEPVE